MWKITDETGEAVTELTDGMLYELRVTIADGGDFDLSEAEKEIKLLRVFLGNKSILIPLNPASRSAGFFSNNHNSLRRKCP